MLIIFLAIKFAYQNSISNYGIMRRAAKKTVVGIYKVMYMVQLKLVNETTISKAYQNNINSDVKLQYECTIPQAFNKITHLAISL